MRKIQHSPRNPQSNQKEYPEPYTCQEANRLNCISIANRHFPISRNLICTSQRMYMIYREKERMDYYACKKRKESASIWPYSEQFELFIQSGKSVFVQEKRWAFIRNVCYQPSDDSFYLIDGSEDDLRILRSFLGRYSHIFSLPRACWSKTECQDSTLCRSSSEFIYYP